MVIIESMRCPDRYRTGEIVECLDMHGNVSGICNRQNCPKKVASFDEVLDESRGEVDGTSK